MAIRYAGLVPVYFIAFLYGMRQKDQFENLNKLTNKNLLSINWFIYRRIRAIKIVNMYKNKIK